MDMMLIDPKVVERWAAEFSVEDFVSEAQSLGMTQESLEGLKEFYEYTCGEWLKYEGDKEELLNLASDDNPMKEYNFSQFFEAFSSCLSDGHGQKFAFVFATETVHEPDEEGRAERKAYEAMGKDARRECEATGKSPIYAERFTEMVDDPLAGDPHQIARECENAYLQSLSEGHSEVYAKSFAWAVSGDMSSEFASAFAYCYELLIIAGETDLNAWCFANSATDILGCGGSFLWAVLQAKAKEFSEENGLNFSSVENVFLNEYEKDVGFPDGELLEASEVEEERECIADILLGKYSLDAMKEKAMGSRKAVKKMSGKEKAVKSGQKSDAESSINGFPEDVEGLLCQMEESDDEEELRRLHTEINSRFDCAPEEVFETPEYKNFSNRLKILESGFETENDIREGVLDMMYPNRNNDDFDDDCFLG